MLITVSRSKIRFVTSVKTANKKMILKNMHRFAIVGKYGMLREKCNNKSDYKI